MKSTKVKLPKKVAKSPKDALTRELNNLNCSPFSAMRRKKKTEVSPEPEPEVTHEDLHKKNVAVANILNLLTTEVPEKEIRVGGLVKTVLTRNYDQRYIEDDDINFMDDSEN